MNTTSNQSIAMKIIAARTLKTTATIGTGGS